MNEYLEKIAKILEVDSVSDADDLKTFPQWDSLTVLSVIAMLDADYGVNLRAADLQEAAHDDQRGPVRPRRADPDP